MQEWDTVNIFAPLINAISNDPRLRQINNIQYFAFSLSPIFAELGIRIRQGVWKIRLAG